MPGLTITLRGLDVPQKISGNVKAKRVLLRKLERRALRDIYRGYQRRVRRRTGRLARSGRIQGNTLTITAPYALFEEEDTRPHEILPRRAGGVLRWVGRDGQEHFARRVRHPGTKGSHALRRSVDAERRAVLASARAILEK